MTNISEGSWFTYRFLLLQPHPLLILQEQGMPALLHVQVSTTHFDKILEGELVKMVKGTRIALSRRGVSWWREKQFGAAHNGNVLDVVWWCKHHMTLTEWPRSGRPAAT